MKISDLEQRVSLLSLIEGKHKLKSIGSGNYRISQRPVCGSKDHLLYTQKLIAIVVLMSSAQVEVFINI